MGCAFNGHRLTLDGAVVSLSRCMMRESALAIDRSIAGAV
jgi:hypothetical protein